MTREIHGELHVPPAALTDKRAVELLPMWAAGGAQHVSIYYDAWEDPAAWGLALVDLARYVAAAYAENEGREQREVLQRIRAGFDAEWEVPTT